MNSNNEKVKELLERNVVPSSLEPENVKKMLDEKAAKKKRNRITLASRFAAAAAAGAVICTSAVHFAGQRNVIDSESGNKVTTSFIGVTDKETDYNILTESYMNGAEDYDRVYRLLSERHERYKENIRHYDDAENGIFFNGADNVVNGIPEAIPDGNVATGTTAGTGDDKDYHDTFNQENGVIEPDKAKTDGEYIYYADNYGYCIRVAKAEDGSFGEITTIDIQRDLPEKKDVNNLRSIRVNEMYVCNGMLIVIAGTDEYKETAYSDDMILDTIYNQVSDTDTYVLFYKTGESPELVSIYNQDGYYKDARISPEGYMYLISSYTSENFENIESGDDFAQYIPTSGMNGNKVFLPADSILLPEDDDECSSNLSYTVIGSINLNSETTPVKTDIKALAGYTGNIYCSAENLYCVRNLKGDSDITRISLDGGKVTPAANGSVDGCVNDQFSMSEYNGYFRIATSKTNYEKVESGVTSFFQVTERYNSLYVLDMDLNIVGEVNGYGIDENIKSVNFSGDMAYVVTFRQTDPLYSFDLSDPTSPKILDEYKITGYSSYMQKWSDGLLLGFGPEADENGISTGVKLVMFDNSDPNNLRELGKYVVSFSHNGIGHSYSPAVSDRKQLLISPEKNLICVPVMGIGEDFTTSYLLFSYENGTFTLKSTITRSSDDKMTSMDRAVYIDDYVYLLSKDFFVSADIASAQLTDEIKF